MSKKFELVGCKWCAQDIRDFDVIYRVYVNLPGGFDMSSQRYYATCSNKCMNNLIGLMKS